MGRPDLAQHVIADLTQGKLASLWFIEKQNHAIGWPHCLSKSMAQKCLWQKRWTKFTDTLGNAKKVNYQSKPQQRTIYQSFTLDGLTTPPGYFPQNVLLNIKGYESLRHCFGRTKLLWIPWGASCQWNKGFDPRHKRWRKFCQYFFISTPSTSASMAILHSGLVKWFQMSQEISLVAKARQLEESLIELSRVGYDNVIGYLCSMIQTWLDTGKTDNSENYGQNLETMYKEGQKVIFDVHKSEFDAEHVVACHQRTISFQSNQPTSGYWISRVTNQCLWSNCAGRRLKHGSCFDPIRRGSGSRFCRWWSVGLASWHLNKMCPRLNTFALLLLLWFQNKNTIAHWVPRSLVTGLCIYR